VKQRTAYFHEIKYKNDRAGAKNLKANYQTPTNRNCAIPGSVEGRRYNSSKFLAKKPEPRGMRAGRNSFFYFAVCTGRERCPGMPALMRLRLLD